MGPGASKNGSRILQKWCHLNFDNGFELGEQENTHDLHFLQIERIQ